MLCRDGLKICTFLWNIRHSKLEKLPLNNLLAIGFEACRVEIESDREVDRKRARMFRQFMWVNSPN